MKGSGTYLSRGGSPGIETSRYSAIVRGWGHWACGVHVWRRRDTTREVGVPFLTTGFSSSLLSSLLLSLFVFLAGPNMWEYCSEMEGRQRQHEGDVHFLECTAETAGLAPSRRQIDPSRAVRKFVRSDGTDRHASYPRRTPAQLRATLAHLFALWDSATVPLTPTAPPAPREAHACLASTYAFAMDRLAALRQEVSVYAALLDAANTVDGMLLPVCRFYIRAYAECNSAAAASLTASLSLPAPEGPGAGAAGRTGGKEGKENERRTAPPFASTAASAAAPCYEWYDRHLHVGALRSCLATALALLAPLVPQRLPLPRTPLPTATASAAATAMPPTPAMPTLLDDTNPNPQPGPHPHIGPNPNPHPHTPALLDELRAYEAALQLVVALCSALSLPAAEALAALSRPLHLPYMQGRATGEAGGAMQDAAWALGGCVRGGNAARAIRLASGSGSSASAHLRCLFRSALPALRCWRLVLADRAANKGEVVDLARVDEMLRAEGLGRGVAEVWGRAVGAMGAAEVGCVLRPKDDAGIAGGGIAGVSVMLEGRRDFARA